MAGRHNIGYEAVEAAIQKLNDDGRKVSIANIREISGGSNSTISTHLAKYRETDNLVNAAPELPVEIINALKVGFAKMFGETELALKNKIEQLNIHLREVQSSLEEMEDSLLAKDSEMTDLKNLHKDQIVKIERECARFEAQASASKVQANASDEALQKAIEEKYEFKIQSEVYKARYDELKK